MKKIVLCALVAVFVSFLHGCADLHVNLSSRDTKTTPFPLITTSKYDKSEPCYLEITAIDGKQLGGGQKQLGGVWSANVDHGTHEVEYACYKNGKIEQSERIKIKAEPGVSYVLKSKSIVDTTNYKSKVLSNNPHVYLERDEAGRLVERSEPVYREVNRTATTVKGITVDVLECKGYPYFMERRRVITCLAEQEGPLGAIFNDDRYIKLFK